MEFVAWHFSKGAKSFFEIWKIYLHFIWRYFAVFHHLRTLFSPWKRDVTISSARGLHPVIWLQNAMENGVTRILGAIVRIFVIICGVISEIATFIIGILLMIVWLLLPLFLCSLFIAAYSYYAWPGQITFTCLMLFLLAIWLLIFSRKLYLQKKNDISKMDLRTLSEQPWFSRVWERVGRMPSNSTLLVIKDKNLLGRFLSSCQISDKEFAEIVGWEAARIIEESLEKRTWRRENLDQIPPIGRSWTYAYTVNLDKYSIDLSEADFSEYKDSALVGHDQDLAMLELILGRPTQNNALIIAEAGVGRHTLVHAFAEKVRSRRASPLFCEKRILELNLAELIISESKHHNVEEVLRNVFYEAAYAGNIILFLSDVHQYLQLDANNHSENISSVILEFLNYPSFQIIGLTTPEKFHQELEKNSEVMKYFEKLLMGESNVADSLKILMHKIQNIEKERVVFTYGALREIVKQSERYISDAPFPEKALDLADEVLTYWSQNTGEKYITPEIVDAVLSQKVKVPIGEINDDEKLKLMNLEDILHERVIGQKFAITQIAETMRRARIGMASAKKPIGSFLFLGPTGVGKTETAKALAEAYFGDEKRMIRLDMSEFQRDDSINRLIGSAETGKTGVLVNKVRENPYALLLLDEIEKVHPDVMNLLLQVLDEGYLTDAFGKKVNFKNLIIIATSNAGADLIKDCIEKKVGTQEIKKEVLDYVIREGIFKPEFLNRFEGVIFFHPLEAEHIRLVSKKLLIEYAKRLKAEKNIAVEFSPDIEEKVAREGFDAIFGARAIDRYIEDKIGDKIVKMIIAGNIRENETINFGTSDLGA